MQALLAFKGSDPQGRHFITVEVRSMGCFNGLNTAGAFVFNAQAARDCVFQVEEDGRLITAFLSSERQDQGVRNYTCIGLGWINHHITSAVGRTSQQVQQGLQVNLHAAALLNRESIRSHFYHPESGDFIPTLRTVTPNEQILRNLFGRGVRTLAPRVEHQQGSHLMRAMGIPSYVGDVWYDFVGSERPSGLAVAYLQTYRNMAGELVGQVNDVIKAKMHWASQIWRTCPQRNSVISLLASVFNYGSDSDITFHAGANYVSYCYKFGFFNTAFLFRNSESMLIEGRYNKGGQSASLMDNIALRLGHTNFNRAVAQPDLRTIATYVNNYNQVANQIAPSALSGNMDSVLNSLRTYITRCNDNRPELVLTALRNYVNDLPNLADPQAPAAATDGAAQGFREWSATAAATVH